MIKNIKLKNFTVFDEIEMDFSPKINIIIGENGTGKSHLLKAAYALCSSCNIFNTTKNKKKVSRALTSRFIRIFMPLEEKLNKIRKNETYDMTKLEASFINDKKIALEFNGRYKHIDVQENKDCEDYSSNPIFIPAKEVLSLIKGICSPNSDIETIKKLFDDTYLDLCNLLVKNDELYSDDNLNFDPRFGSVYPAIANAIGGKYDFENGNFCFQKGEYIERRAKDQYKYGDKTETFFKGIKGCELSNIMTAEGFRKIGVLQQLLANKTLNPGISGPLFWDEPESNMNPRLVKLLVEILIELSRNGQQIIIATHDYVLLKWFDLLTAKGKGDHVRFHSLSRNKTTGKIEIESANTYQQLNNNAIASTFSDLYDSEIDRALGGQDK